MKLKMHGRLLTHCNLQAYFAFQGRIVLLDLGGIADNDCAVQRRCIGRPSGLIERARKNCNLMAEIYQDATRKSLKDAIQESGQAR